MSDTNVVGTTAANISIASVLNDLTQQTENLFSLINILKALNEADTFQHLSKQMRNNSLSRLINTVGTIEDTSKVVFRQLKKVKRTRPADSLVDKALILKAINFDEDLDGDFEAIGLNVIDASDETPESADEAE